MTESDDRLAALGRTLAERYHSRTPPPIGWREGIATLADAYAVQRGYVATARDLRRTWPIGYKVGLTTAAMQAFCKVDTPICGRILAADYREDGAELRIGDYVRLGVESELAIRLAADIDPAALADADLRAAIGSVHAAFEIIDDRAADYADLVAGQIVADNGWNAGIVVGPGVAADALPSLDGLRGELRRNGEPIGSGSSSDVLTGPLSVLRWLSRFLQAQGERLRAGDWIMTGSIVTTQFPLDDTFWQFTLDGLPPVSVRVRDQ